MRKVCLLRRVEMAEHKMLGVCSVEKEYRCEGLGEGAVAWRRGTGEGLV